MSIPDFLTPKEVIAVFDNDSLTWTLPNGEDIAGWVGNSGMCRSYVYIWFETDDVPGVRRGSVEYRVFPFDQPGGDWQALGNGGKVHQRTKDDYETSPSEGAEIGANFKLPAGRYSFEFRVEYEGQRIELRGGNFRLFRNEAEVSANHDELVRAFRALPRDED